MPTHPPRRKQPRLDPRVYSQTGVICHLTACTTNKTPLFSHQHCAALVLDEIQHLHGDSWRVLGFSVMPNHVHLLVLNVSGSLVDFMRLLKGRSSKSLRQHVEGPVWQRSFHDHILRRNEDISGVIRYLLENPIRAGLTNDWTTYPWCGSLEWPDIDPEFFAVNPSDVMWGEVFAIRSSREDPDDTEGRESIPPLRTGAADPEP